MIRPSYPLSLALIASLAQANPASFVSPPDPGVEDSTEVDRVLQDGRRMTTHMRSPFPGMSAVRPLDAGFESKPPGRGEESVGIPCNPINRRQAGSLLLFPEYDNRNGATTIFSITNTSFTQDVYVEFVYIGRFGSDLEGGLNNGGFEDNGNGWTVDISPAQGGPQGSVTFQNNQACLLEGSSLLTTISQDFVMPAGAQYLEFDLILSPGFDTTANFIPDAFEAQLLDGALSSVVPTWNVGATSFFNLQEDLTSNLGPGVNYNGTRVQLDVSGVPEGLSVTLFFDLIGADSDWEGGVKIENPVITSGAPSDIGCTEFNRVEHLTPNDTLSLVTSHHNPTAYQGFAYAFAKNSTGKAISFDHLVGQSMATNGLVTSDYAINAVAFGSPLPDGALTDLDGDWVRDMNGMEYDQAPDQIHIPRFLAQGLDYRANLILVAMAGGPSFTTTLDFLAYNDNEEVFSTQHSFYCWDRVPLLSVSALFSQDFLSNGTNHDLEESLGGLETGWIRIDGGSASSTAHNIDDPAFYAVLVEGIAETSSADLPFEQCHQDAHLLPRGVHGDNEE